MNNVSVGNASNEGADVNTTTTVGNGQTNYGVSAIYKSNFNTFIPGVSGSFYANTNLAAGIIKNSIFAPGISSTSYFALNANFGNSFSMGISLEPRINTFYFSKQSNISGGVHLFIGNSTHFQLSVSNDFFPGLMNIGYNGTYRTFGATDGGLTQYMNVGIWNKNYTRGLLLQAYGYTPHRLPFTEPQYSVEKGEGGILYNDGLFAVENYHGGYRTYTNLTYMYNDKNRGFSFGISAGIQDDFGRVLLQGMIHHYYVGGSGEFPDYYKSKYPFIQMTFTNSIFNNKRSLKQISHAITDDLLVRKKYWKP